MKIQQLFEDKELSAQQLTHAILAVRQQYHDKGHTLHDIGNGLCDDFVRGVMKYVKGNFGYDMIRSNTVFDYETAQFCDDGMLDIDLVTKHWKIKLPPHLMNEDFYIWFSGCTHVWIYHESSDKHYDAAAPEGVDVFIDLPFFKGNIEQYESYISKR